MVDIDDDVSDLDEDEESELKKLSSSDKDSDDSASVSGNGSLPRSSSSSHQQQPPSGGGDGHQTIEQLQETLAMLHRQLEVKNEQLEAALVDMDKMRSVTMALMGDDTPSQKDPPTEKSVSGIRTENQDSGYAGSYAHYGIHHEMLSDRVRCKPVFFYFVFVHFWTKIQLSLP